MWIFRLLGGYRKSNTYVTGDSTCTNMESKMKASLEFVMKKGI
jgi:hypothetical protein